jgi:hypothetical protein
MLYMGVLLHSENWNILNYFDIIGFVRIPQTPPKVYQ